MVGYPESLTDPSYRGQILVFTYPLIGNYGVPSDELNEYGFSKHFESEGIHVRGMICSQVSMDFSHHAGTKSLPEWLKEQGIPALTGVDTRKLTKKLRETGVMLGRMVNDTNAEVRKYENAKMEIEDPNVRNLVEEVSCKEVIWYRPNPNPNPNPNPTIVAYDCGMKRNILRSFLRRGVTIVRVPWNFDLSKANFSYDGVFLSNGPGDPKKCTETITQVKWAIDQGIPTFGICLGIQLMALAIGGNTYKLKFGHRGANQPCIADMGLRTKDKGGLIPSPKSIVPSPQKCIITSQNHGFAVEESSLPPGWHVSFRNANDGTVEGIAHESGKFFAVQFHPEATPGPEDAGYLFDDFLGALTKAKVASY
jgi:carbamoyl-phosphate synthase small subunit